MENLKRRHVPCSNARALGFYRLRRVTLLLSFLSAMKWVGRGARAYREKVHI